MVSIFRHEPVLEEEGTEVEGYSHGSCYYDVEYYRIGSCMDEGLNNLEDKDSTAFKQAVNGEGFFVRVKLKAQY